MLEKNKKTRESWSYYKTASIEQYFKINDHKSQIINKKINNYQVFFKFQAMLKMCFQLDIVILRK